MKIKTDYDGCKYITAGKIYELHLTKSGSTYIFDDNGNAIMIYVFCCHHIDGNQWEVINDES